MKKNVLLSLLASVLILSSCEKVIDFDLNEAEKKYVVEANVSDVEGQARVLISQTQNFDEPTNLNPTISGATVTITEVGGSVYTLSESTVGVYTHPTLKTEPGKRYQLEVVVNGETFTAENTAPTAVPIDSVFITDELLFGEFRKIANVRYQDPVGRGDSYRFIQFVNGNRQKQIMIMNDDYIDGRMVTSTLFYFTDDDEDEEGLIKSGDLVKIEFHKIPAPMYDYWFSLLRSSTGGNQQATPSNPVSNMRGGALGYFSTHTYEAETITVP